MPATVLQLRRAKKLTDAEREANRRERARKIDDEMRERLLRAQNAFIQETLIYSETGDSFRFLRAQSNFIRTQSLVLRRLGVS